MKSIVGLHVERKFNAAAAEAAIHFINCGTTEVVP
jgi:hypothetical protein